MVDIWAIAKFSQVFGFLSMWHWGLNRRQIGCCAYHMPQPSLTGLSRPAWLSSVFPALAEGVGWEQAPFLSNRSPVVNSWGGKSLHCESIGKHSDEHVL